MCDCYDAEVFFASVSSNPFHSNRLCLWVPADLPFLARLVVYTAGMTF